MKNWILFVTAVALSTTLFGQQVSYKVAKDNPKDVPNAFLNVELLHMEMPLANILGSSFCLGGNVYVNYHNRLGVEATFRRGWLNLIGVKRYQFEAGGFLNLRSKAKVKNQKVVLSSKSYSSGGKTYTETKSIQCPALRLKTFGVRGGFFTNQEAFEYEDKIASSRTTYQYRWSGIYLGILSTRQMNYRINTDNFGECGAGFIRRFYADVTIHPFASLDTIQASDPVYTGKIGRIGYRAGVEVMPANRRKIQKSIYIKMEAGWRPMDTYFLMCSMGFNIKRTFKKLGVEEDKREVE